MNKVIIEVNGKRYQTKHTSHPCRDNKSCSLFSRGVCNFCDEDDGVPEKFPCDAIFDTLERAGLVLDFDYSFKEIK